MIKKYLTILLLLFSFSLKANEPAPVEIIVCENSIEMLDWDLRFIREAKHSIELSACYCGGTVLQKIFTAIQKRLHENPDLQVHVLVSPTFFDAKDKALLAELKEKFSNRFHLQVTATVLTLLPEYSGIDNHVKCIIVDETFFSVGGTNLDEVLCTDGKVPQTRNPDRENSGLNLPGGPAGVRDQDVVGRGSIASSLRSTFFEVYAVWENYFKTNHLESNPASFRDHTRKFPVPLDQPGQVSEFDSYERKVFVKSARDLLSGSMHCPNLITQEYIRLIKNAKKEIFIGNLYFSPVDPIYNELLSAANRGVEIQVITNGITENSPDYTQFFAWANRIHYLPLFYGRTFHFWEKGTVAKTPIKKVKVYEYNVFDIVYHKKVMVVDRRYTIVGSYNLGIRSDTSDYELILLIDSPEVAEQILTVLQTDRGLSKEVAPNDAKGWYFDPVKSYMGQVQKKFHGLL